MGVSSVRRVIARRVRERSTVGRVQEGSVSRLEGVKAESSVTEEVREGDWVGEVVEEGMRWDDNT